MRTLREVLHLCRAHLEERAVPDARRAAEEVIGHALYLSRLDLYLDLDRPILEEELQRCRGLLQRRANREPIQYIVGETTFFGCRIELSSHVLVPRPETELLADHVARSIEERGVRGVVLWDVCCGSGCLGLSLKRRFPQLRVVLSDICPKALKVAERNAAQLQLDVCLRHGDLLEPFASECANFFVCNPPYVSEEEYPYLECEVKCEPRHALVAENQGLSFYQRLSSSLYERMAPGGLAFLEIGTSQGGVVRELFSRSPWKSLRCERDWSLRDRFIFLEKE